MPDDRLTDRSHWDDYWENYKLPAEVRRSDGNLLINAELDVFERYLPHEPLSMLEIGGAPGQYLAYFHKQFGYRVHSLDYSGAGCRKTEENFQKLGIAGGVYHKDLFGDLSGLPLFDIVFSMGLVEHFEDLDGVIGRHLELLRPGGILMIGMPNFMGINHFYLKRLAPVLLAMHNLHSMDTDNWNGFEKEYRLEEVFKGYIGGFEPMTFMMREKDTGHALLFLTARLLTSAFHKRFGLLRKVNSKNFSAYIMGIYRKPAQ